MMLADQDSFIYRARFNWTYGAAAWGWFIFSAIPLAMLLYSVAVENVGVGSASDAFLISSAAAWSLGALQLATMLIKERSTVIALTSTSLVLSSGILSRDSREISVEKIDEIDLRQSVLGRLCGYGVLTLRGEGIGAVELPPIDRPRLFRQRLEEIAAAAEGIRLHAERAGVSAGELSGRAA